MSKYPLNIKVNKTKTRICTTTITTPKKRYIQWCKISIIIEKNTTKDIAAKKNVFEIRSDRIQKKTINEIEASKKVATIGITPANILLFVNKNSKLKLQRDWKLMEKIEVRSLKTMEPTIITIGNLYINYKNWCV
jgi:hypothetical protein